MQCDLCGERPAAVLASVEGSKVRACLGCARFGTVLGQISAPPARAPKATKAPLREPPAAAGPKKETLLLVRPDAGQLIKGARERLGLTQEELAKKLNEKASVLHHIECSRAAPSLDLARKFERALRLRLVEAYTEGSSEPQSRAASSLTIGDLLSGK